MEAGLNIVISIAAVIKFGLVGVAMGTVVAFSGQFNILHTYPSILLNAAFLYFGNILWSMGLLP